MLENFSAAGLRPFLEKSPASPRNHRASTGLHLSIHRKVTIRKLFRNRFRWPEKFPVTRPECDATLFRGRMFGWNFDLHPLACAAYFQFDAPLAAGTAAGHHRTCDAATATIQQFDIVRAEEELRITIRHILDRQADIAIHQPDFALFDPYRKRAGLAYEAIDAGEFGLS